jgi:phosphoribosylaminoimidazole carboxylase (NCAIR synthetase)
VKIVLPGAAVGLIGGGENGRLFAHVANRVGYRIHTFPASEGPDSYDDVNRVREFASSVDVVTVTGFVPQAALQVVEEHSTLRPSAAAISGAAQHGGAGTSVSADGEIAFCLIAARAVDGEQAFYAPIALDRIDGHLVSARSPASIGARITREATAVVRDILEQLDFAGVACVTFRLTPSQELLVEGVTPYSQSSGYLTIEACITSQFEQQLRAVCGLPLGNTDLLRPAAMATLSDEIRSNGEPNWAGACALPDVKLYVYETAEQIPEKNWGHVTATADSATLARQIVRAARAALTPQ